MKRLISHVIQELLEECEKFYSNQNAKKIQAHLESLYEENRADPKAVIFALQTTCNRSGLNLGQLIVKKDILGKRETHPQIQAYLELLVHLMLAPNCTQQDRRAIKAMLDTSDTDGKTFQIALKENAGQSMVRLFEDIYFALDVEKISSHYLQGLLHLYASGVSRNLIAAYHEFSLAAEFGDELGKRRKAFCEYSGTGVSPSNQSLLCESFLRLLVSRTLAVEVKDAIRRDLEQFAIKDQRVDFRRLLMSVYVLLAEESRHVEEAELHYQKAKRFAEGADLQAQPQAALLLVEWGKHYLEFLQKSATLQRQLIACEMLLAHPMVNPQLNGTHQARALLLFEYGNLLVLANQHRKAFEMYRQSAQLGLVKAHLKVADGYVQGRYSDSSQQSDFGSAIEAHQYFLNQIHTLNVQEQDTLLQEGWQHFQGYYEIINLGPYGLLRDQANKVYLDYFRARAKLGGTVIYLQTAQHLVSHHMQYEAVKYYGLACINEMKQATHPNQKAYLEEALDGLLALCQVDDWCAKEAAKNEVSVQLQALYGRKGSAQMYKAFKHTYNKLVNAFERGSLLAGSVLSTFCLQVSKMPRTWRHPFFSRVRFEKKWREMQPGSLCVPHTGFPAWQAASAPHLFHSAPAALARGSPTPSAPPFDTFKAEEFGGYGQPTDREIVMDDEYSLLQRAGSFASPALSGARRRLQFDSSADASPASAPLPRLALRSPFSFQS